MGRRWFGYVSDNGELYAVELDEANTEAVNSALDEAPTQVPSNRLPAGMEPRTVRFNSPNGLYSRKVVLLGNTPASLNAVPLEVEFATKDGPVNMFLTSYIGERNRFVTAEDTMQLNGDAEVFGAAPP